MGTWAPGTPLFPETKPRTVLISSDGVHQQYFAQRGTAADYRAKIRSYPWMRSDQLQEWQLRTLNSVIRHARRDVPFYANRLPSDELTSLDDLCSIPILTRDDVIHAGPQLHSRAISTRTTIDIQTGGTVGTPLTIRTTPRVIERHYAAFTRFREWIGIPDRARVAAFGGRSTIGDGPPWSRVPGTGAALICSADGINGESIDGYLDALVEFAPEIIDGYPSTLLPLARRIKANRVSGVRPSAVITSGEPLTPFARRQIEEAFSCPLFDHYGSAEMVAFISECRAGSYHVNSDYGVVEILRDGRAARPGEPGELVATGFLNEAMPLIRYATGDVAVPGTTHCPCGRTFPTVERLMGRVDEAFVAPDGHLVGRIEVLLRGVSTVMEVRLVQDAPDHVTLEAVASGPIDPLEVATIMTELRQRLGSSISADFARVSRIPRTPSGRYRAVQALVSPTGGVRVIPESIARVPA
jgi:phenylacetate-CoA ligase